MLGRIGKTGKSVVALEILITFELKRFETCPGLETLGYNSGLGLKSNKCYPELVITEL
jgi:hypothetical protein